MATTKRSSLPDAPVPAYWTLEDYHHATEAGAFGGRRVQLVRGEIVEMPPMSDPHILASGHLERLFARLRSDADDRVRTADGVPEVTLELDTLFRAAGLGQR